MYAAFNAGDWPKCFSLLDPRLKAHRSLDLPAYAESLAAFKRAYGVIRPWHIRISLHLDERAVRDPRPFAYVYVVWQDERHGFHMFRERWVKEHGAWYTRVAGLVPRESAASS